MNKSLREELLAQFAEIRQSESKAATTMEGIGDDNYRRMLYQDAFLAELYATSLNKIARLLSDDIKELKEFRTETISTKAAKEYRLSRFGSQP